MELAYVARRPVPWLFGRVRHPFLSPLTPPRGPEDFSSLSPAPVPPDGATSVKDFMRHSTLNSTAACCITSSTPPIFCEQPPRKPPSLDCLRPGVKWYRGGLARC